MSYIRWSLAAVVITLGACLALSGVGAQERKAGSAPGPAKDGAGTPLSLHLVIAKRDMFLAQRGVGKEERHAIEIYCKSPVRWRVTDFTKDEGSERICDGTTAWFVSSFAVKDKQFITVQRWDFKRLIEALGEEEALQNLAPWKPAGIVGAADPTMPPWSDDPLFRLGSYWRVVRICAGKVGDTPAIRYGTAAFLFFVWKSVEGLCTANVLVVPGAAITVVSA